MLYALSKGLPMHFRDTTPTPPRLSALESFTRLLDGAIAFTATDGRTFLRFDSRTFAVRSSLFRAWFASLAYARLDRSPSQHMWSAICRHFEGVAQRFPDANGVVVNRRTAYADDNAIHIDLANSSNHYVEVLPTGWRLVESPSIDDALPFESSPGTRSLPAPSASLSASPLDTLRATLNLAGSTAWLRCLTWLLAAFRPSGPFPILILRGPAASGKSYAARVLRTLVDPNASPFTPTPRSAAQLLHLARHNWVLAFDHVTHLSPNVADALCRITSGAGLSFHEEDHSEPTQHWIRRPILLTVTPDCDLPAAIADRALFVDLPALTPETRRPEPILNDTLSPHLPQIFGALCDALSKCLAAQPQSTVTQTRHSTAVSWAAPAFPEIPAAVDAPTWTPSSNPSSIFSTTPTPGPAPPPTS
jgi:hypothetical protein